MKQNLILRKDFRLIGIFSALAGSFTAAATLGYALAIGQMVDAAANGTYEKMVVWVGVTIALYVTQELLGVTYNFAISWVTPEYVHKTRGLLLVHWLKIVPKRKMSAGRMNTAIFNDLDQTVENYENALNSAGYGAASLLGGISVMFWLHWIVGLVAIGVLVINTCVSLPAGMIAGKVAQKVSTSTQTFYGQARETDDNKIQYLSMRLLGKFKQAISGIYKTYAKEQLGLQVKSSFALNTAAMVAICLNFAPIVAGGLLFGQQEITYGSIAILVILSREVSSAAIYISGALDGFMIAHGLKKKYIAKPTTQVLSLGYEDFTPWFSAEKKAGYKLNLEISKGKKCLLKGPNGIGKSTALEVLMRPIEYDGKLRVNNQEIIEKEKLDGYHAIAPVTKDALFESIGQIKESSLQSPSDLFLKIAEVVYPILERKGKNKEASQGEKQILSLLHALANNPAILLIDETLSSVEEKVRKQIYNFLLAQKEMAVVVVDHTMDSETEGRFDEVVNLK